ncbi:hypothetical protein [Spongiactinospora sp. 9N601]|uniref:hypothetical protein n=1 Tax=Spongiactinospora sp. 9N601 TaxID=3375149 RepID=UPI003799DC33
MSAMPEQAKQDDIAEAPLSDEELDNVSGAWSGMQVAENNVIDPRVIRVQNDNLRHYV